MRLVSSEEYHEKQSSASPGVENLVVQILRHETSEFLNQWMYIERILRKECTKRLVMVFSGQSITSDFSCHLYNVLVSKFSKAELHFFSNKEKEPLWKVPLKTTSPKVRGQQLFLPNVATHSCPFLICSATTKRGDLHCRGPLLALPAVSKQGPLFLRRHISSL